MNIYRISNIQLQLVGSQHRLPRSYGDNEQKTYEVQRLY